MKAILFSIFLFSLGIDIARPQTLGSNHNSVTETTVRVPGINNVSQLSVLSVSQANRNIQYFDGLGRSVQTVNWQGSPQFKDIVKPIEYDLLGREAVKFLPYTEQFSNDGSFKGSYFQNQRNYYKTVGSWDLQVVKTDYPYSLTVFENSGLNRAQQLGAPGAAWQPSSPAIASSGHVVRNSYSTNTGGEVPRWQEEANGSFSRATFYVAGSLHKVITSDENNITSAKVGSVEEFKDLEGHTVLKRVWETETKSLDTYYIYDRYGDLRYVVPPGYTGTSLVDNEVDFNELIYAYRYDDRKRITEKKIPGKGWEWIVYNQNDLPVMTQDAVQRGKTVKEWSYIKYDALGRIIETGILTASYADRETAQAASDAHFVSSNRSWEDRTEVVNPGSTPVYTRYTNQSFPVVSLNPRMVNYYDDHRFDGSNTVGLSLVGFAYLDKNRTLLTGTLVYKDDGTSPLLTVNYYDDRARLIQSVSQNHLGGTDRVTNTYSFVGELLSSTRVHTANGQTTTTVTTNSYDHVGRLTETRHKVNAQGEVILAKNKYNGIGQLKQQQQHSENGGTDYLNTVDHTYNERGWTRSASSLYFSYGLDYNVNSAGTVLGNAQYNGNISRQQWGHGSTLGSTYSYSYDKLNRLTSGSSTGTVMSEEISYDDMGNIVHLNRDGHATGTSYTYTGNRLKSLTGALETAAELLYDANGNATRDRRGMAMTYNQLNLPATAALGGTTVAYQYDATGSKLRKTATVGGITTVRDYVGGIEYSRVGSGSATIEMIHIPGGYLQNNGGSYTYHYNLTDHLGNVRATLQRTSATTGTVIQKHDYYPFGKAKAIVVSGINKYLYNGKEIQGELGDQYDYGARFYDAEIGRWNVVDPLADEFESLSPYNYGVNNPVVMIDPTGMAAIYNWEKGQYEDEKGKKVEFDEAMASHGMNVDGSSLDPPNEYKYNYGTGEYDFVSDKGGNQYDILHHDYASFTMYNYNGGPRLGPGRWGYSFPKHSGALEAVYPETYFIGGTAMAKTTSWLLGKFLGRLAAKTGYINLASFGRTAHIIAGDATGGGHAWFGSLKSFANGLSGSKSMFPATWSNSKIMHAVSDVVVNNQWIQQTGKAGAMFTKSGQPVRFVVEGSYQGTKMRVITTHTDIITAFPIK